MARTWDLKLNKDRITKVKALKKDAENVGHAIRDILNIHQHFTEITGVVGGEKHETTYFSPFGGGGQVADRDSYKKDLDAFFKNLPAVVIDTKPVIAQARIIFKKHLPIVDNRKTLGEVKERNEQTKITQEENKAKSKAFHIKYCGQDRLDLPVNQAAIVLLVTFDDSDIQRDYSNRHASLGPRMLLSFVPAGARKEAVARRILERYPELCKLNWEWHTENYSGGHGNYLESCYTGESLKHHAYDGRKEVNTRYEIRFDSYSKTFQTYKDYPGEIPETSKAVSSNSDISVTENEEKDGVEIRFSEKPDTDIRTDLKSHGFRWSKFSNCWYRKRTPEALAYAQGLAV